MIARDTLTIQNHTEGDGTAARLTNIAFQGWSDGEDSANAVSYTHLTLPTIFSE